jgi:hypothetical protein
LCTVERLSLVAELDLRQEAEPARVDPEDWDMGGRRLLGRPQQGAIAPDADDEAGAV